MLPNNNFHRPSRIGSSDNSCSHAYQLRIEYIRSDTSRTNFLIYSRICKMKRNWNMTSRKVYEVWYTTILRVCLTICLYIMLYLMVDFVIVHRIVS